MMLTSNAATLQGWRTQLDRGRRVNWYTMNALVTTARRLLDGKQDPATGFHEIGRRCALDGHSLTDTMGWVESLMELCPRRVRRRLDHRHLAESLGSGWTSGEHERRCTDSDLLVSAGYLGERLSEVFASAGSLGFRDMTGQDTAVIVLEPNTGLLGPRARASIRSTITEYAQRAFQHGETVCSSSSGRILVVVLETPQLKEQLNHLVTECQRSPMMAGCRLQGWIEHLPPHHQDLEAFLADLTG